MLRKATIDLAANATKKSLLTVSVLFLGFILAACNNTMHKGMNDMDVAMATPANAVSESPEAVAAEVTGGPDVYAMYPDERPATNVKQKPAQATTVTKKKRVTTAAKKTPPAAEPRNEQPAASSSLTTAANAPKPLVVRKILAKSKVMEFKGHKFCQKYRATTIVDGMPQQKTYGIACKQPTGKWRIMS